MRRGADVERIVDGQVVDVHRRAGVALDVVLVRRAEDPRVHERPGRRDDDGRADVDGGLVDRGSGRGSRRRPRSPARRRSSARGRTRRPGSGRPRRGRRRGGCRRSGTGAAARRRLLQARSRHEHRVRDLAGDAPRRRSRKPYASPAPASAAARTVTGTCVSPPGASVTEPAARRSRHRSAATAAAPRRSRCRRRRPRRTRRAAATWRRPLLTLRSAYESETGSVKSFGSFAASDVRLAGARE